VSRLVPPGKLYESLLLELEWAMTAAADAAETPIAATVMADNIGPTVGRAWLLRFTSMEEFLVWTISGCEQDDTDIQGEAAHKEAE
jgi:hypothetical protein